MAVFLEAAGHCGGGGGGGVRRLLFLEGAGVLVMVGCAEVLLCADYLIGGSRRIGRESRCIRL